MLPLRPMSLMAHAERCRLEEIMREEDENDGGIVYQEYEYSINEEPLWCVFFTI